MDSGALEGVIATSIGALRIYSLHLSYISRRERIRQLETVLDIHRRATSEGGAWVGPATIRAEDWSAGDDPPPMPEDAVVMGDFNCRPASPEYDLMVGPQDEYAGRVHHVDAFVDAWAAAGYSEDEWTTWTPTSEGSPIGPRRLDYCFLSPRLARSVVRCWVDHSAAGSDHYPCWTELSF